MDLQAVGAIIIFVVLLGLVVGIGLVGRRKMAQFEQACLDRGWQVVRGEGPGFDQRVSGSTRGVSWQYEYFRYSRGTMRSAGRHEMRTSRIHVDSVGLPGEVVLVMPKAAQAGQFGSMIKAMNQFGGLGRTVLELIVVQGLQGDASDVDLFMKLQPVQAGSDALRQQFTVLATSEDAADKVLRRGEMALLEFANDPAHRSRLRYTVVLAWGRGLTLPVEQAITDADLLEALAGLVAELANSAKGW